MSSDNIDILNMKIDNNLDVGNLLAFERKLMQQRKWIEDTINQIKTQRTALQVENMNIENILSNEIAKQRDLENNSKTNEENAIISSEVNEEIVIYSTEEMDSAKSTMNTTMLDLSIVKMIDDIIKTNDCTEENESEEESELEN